MSIRPFRDIKRKKTKEVRIGNVVLGNNNPIDDFTLPGIKLPDSVTPKCKG